MNPGDTNRPVGADSLPTASEIAPAELSAPVTNAEQFDRWLDQHSDSMATDPNRIYNPADPGDNGLRINVSKFVLIVIGLIFVLSAGSLGAYAAYNAMKGQPKSGQQGDFGSVQANILLDTSGRNLHINYDTTITDGRNFEATGDVLVQNQSVQAFKVQDTGGSNIMVADTKNKTIMIGDKPPGQVSLKVNGDITVNGALVSTDSGYSLSGQGLSIGGVLVCTANGCVSSSSPAPTPASPTIDVANLAYLNKTNNFSGINKFTAGGNVFVGDGSGLSALNAGSVSSGTLSDSRLSANVTKNNGNNTFSGSNTFSAQIQAAAGINSVTGYSVNGTAGGSFSCAANQLLQQAVVSGGIITSGTCVAVAGGSTPTLQDVYDASAPANVVLSGASGVFSIQDAASPLATNLFEVGSNGNSTLYFAVNNLGISVTGNVNTTGQYQVGGVQISSANLSNDANLAKLNANQAFSGNNTFSSVSNSFTGSGAGLTSLNASNISSGTLSDTRLSNNVALLNALQTFTGQNTFSNVSNSFTGNGSGLTSLNASNVSSGTLNDARLSANVTLQGNTFNGASQLVQLTAGGILPVLNGSNLTSLNATNFSNGTLADARLSSNVALLNANNIFLGNDSFHLNSTALTVQDAVSPLAGNLFEVTNSTGATKYFEVNASGVKINGNDACTTAGNCTGVSGGAIGGGGTAGKLAKFTGSGFTIGDSLLSESGSVVAVNGSINIASGNTYQINGSQISSAALSNDSNLAKLNGTQTFTGANTFSNASNSFTGNGSGLTSLNASNVLSGTLNDARLSSNVALKNANNTFTGNNVFSLNTAGLAVQDALTPLGTNLFEVTNNAGTTKYFTVSATALQFNGNDVCTTAGNCTGVSGGAIGGSGTAGKIAKFTGSGFTIGDSLISDNGTAVTVGGVLTVNTITPTATLTVGTPSQTLALQGDASTSLSAKGVSFTNTLVFAAPALANHTITIPNASGTVAVSASGPLSLDAAGNLTCPSCLTTNGTGGGSGVSSVNSLTGAITLAGTANQVVITPSANTLTFSTPQDIATTSSPTFANINVASGGLYEINGIQISSSALSNDTNLAKLNGTQTFTGANTFSNASNSFTGDGSGLTSLNASNVSSGTLNDLRLSSNVPLKNAANTFTNTNTFQTSSTTAFQVQSAAAAETLLTVDSSARSVSGGNLIKIGNSTGTDTATTILVVDSATSAPTSNLGALNGGLFYNSTTGHMNAIEGGTVKELCNKTDLGCGSAGVATTLAGAYANGTATTDSVLALDTTRGGVIVKDNSSPIGGTLFGVQSNTGTKYLDVTSAGISTTNVSVAAGGYISIAGGNTASRPGSPTEGMLYYDTATKSLLVYANGKWQADRSSSTKIVAMGSPAGCTGSSPVASLNPDSADYVVTSCTSAQTTINSAITALGATGGTVYLEEGTYIIDGQINMASNMTLAGAGPGTILKLKDSINVAINTIVSSSVSRVTFRDFKLDGNRTNNSAGTQNGLYMNSVGSGSGTSAVPGYTVDNVTVQNFRSAGVYLNGSSNSSITRNNIINNGGEGIHAQWPTTNAFLTINGNTVQGNSSYGIYSDISAISYSTVSNNTIISNSNDGIYMNGNNNSIDSNTIYSNSGKGIELQNGNNTVAGNNVSSNTNDGIYAHGSNNTISSNTAVSNSGFGIDTDNVSSNNSVSGNMVSGNASGGINLGGSTNQASANTVISNTNIGIKVTGNNNAVSGNTVASNTTTGIYVNCCSSNNNIVSGNQVSSNASNGITVDASNGNQISGNRVYDNGGAGSSSSILVFANAFNTPDKNIIKDNIITDTAGTGYAIELSGGLKPTNTYISNNAFSGTGATAILDTGTTGTTYINQSKSSTSDYLYRFGADSATAFQVQNAGGSESLLSIDTTARSASGGNLIKIGNSTGTDTATTILVVDSATAAPTSNLGALNGGLFYNSTTGHINVIEGGAVKELCNKTDLGCGSASTTTLQNAYDNSSSPATITTSSTAKGIIFKAGSGFDSASLFQVQNSGGQQVLNVSTTTNSVSIPQGNLTVSGLSTPNPPSVSSSATGGTLAAATYYYQVAAVNANGTTPATPSNPASVTTSGTTSQNTLTWTAVTNASSYNVYRSTNGTTWFKNNVPSSTTSIVDNGTNYNWSTSAGLPTANTTGGNLTVNGAATFANLANSTNALDVQDATGDSILRVDSTDRFIGINNATPAATLDVVASPPAPNFSFGFENGTLGAFSQTGPCTVSATFAHTGSYGWGNGASQDCTLTLTRSLASAGTITFWAKYFTAPPNPNEVKFRIDGANTLTTNGTVGWTQFTYAVSAGTHTFNWITGQSVYGEYLYVDDVSIVPNASSSTAALFNGGNVGIGTAAPNATLETDGTAIFKATTNVTSTFQIQNASSDSLFNADTTNGQITIGRFVDSSLSAPASPGAAAGANTGGTLSGAAGTTYYYKVSAMTIDGETPLSSEVSINGQSFTKLSSPGALTVGTPSAGGAVTIGTHSYKVTFVTANGETTGGTVSSQVNVTTGGTQTVPLTAIPTGPAGTTQRKIYRTVAGDTGNYLLLTTLADNSTTTYNDTTADGSLGAAAPASNTATTNTNNATITWSAVTGATGYRVYRSTSSGAQSSYQTASSSPFTDTGAAGTSLTNTSLAVKGTQSVQAVVDSATAFQIQNASGADTLLSVDTTARSASGGNLIKIGNSSGTDTNTTILVVDSATAIPTSNLSALSGGIFYNSTTNHLNVIENGTVKEVCNKPDLGCGSTAATSQTKVVAMGSPAGCTGTSPVASADTNADYVVTSCTSAQTTINTAITALGSTGGTVYLKEGTYIIDGQINMASNVTLMGSGPSTIIKIKDSSAINAIAATSKSRMVIKNLVLDGNKTNQVSNIDAFEFSTLGSGSGTTAVPGVKIDNVTVQNFNGPSTVNTTSVVNSSITNSWFINNGKVLLSGSNYFNFSNNKVMGSGGLGIHLNGGSNNTIYGNIIQGSGNNDIQIDSNATNNVISGNTISGGTRGFEVDASAANNTISNNTITGTSGNGMNLSVATKNTVTGNTINGSGGDGINAASADYSTITGNTISGNAASGINIQSNHLTVSGNDISSNTNEGIYMNGASYNNVNGNKLYNNGSGGRSSIKVDSSSNNNLIGNNQIYDSVSSGKPAILIFQSSDTNNTLSSNIFSGTAGPISDLGTNTIYANQLTSSTTGFLQRVGTDSTSAIQLQNASGTTLLNFDTTNSIFNLLTDNANHTIHIGDGGTSGAGTFPSTTVLDNFNRANGVLTSPWVGMNNSQMYINTNAAAAGPASGRWQSRYEGSGPFTDSESYATLAVLDDWQLVGVRVQQTTAGSGLNSGYYAQYGGGTFNITKKVNNVETSLGTMSLTLAAGDKIGIRVIGNTITAYSYQSGTWTLRLTATDSTFTSGYLAMEQGTANSSQTGRLDDFGGGNIANAIQAITIGSTNLGSNLNLQAGSGNINLTSAASTIVKPTQNSSTAFQVQNAGGASLFTVDTSNNQITLGSASATPVLLILGNKNTSGDPTCTNGAIYYNSSFNQLRACVNGGWTSFGNNDGWVFDGDQTWTYASSTSFTVSGDQTGTFTPGTRIKLTQSATVEYFVVTSSSYSSPNTTVNITGGSDYTLANSAISANAHSYAANPQGYPTAFNYTLTYTGFSANPSTIEAKFWVVGRTCTVQIATGNGTSNSTAFTINAPINSASGLDVRVNGQVADNGNDLVTPGMMRLTGSSSTINIYKDGTFTNGFTTSGVKAAYFTMSYQF
jgi:parallel beta-helix repeat protein